jgi:hypothetical protein
MAVIDLAKIGTQILLAGLILQLAFYFFFSVVVTSTCMNSRQYGLHGRPGLKRLFTCIYGSMLLLAIRNIYRIVEFAQFMTAMEGGQNEATEAAFYVLDLVPVSLAIALLIVLHPGILLKSIAANPSLPSHHVLPHGDVAAGAVGVDARVQLASASTSSNKAGAAGARVHTAE